MHASCISPGSIDFTIFECYLKGYDVEETIEFLVAFTRSPAGNALSIKRNACGSGEYTDDHNTSTSNNNSNNSSTLVEPRCVNQSNLFALPLNARFLQEEVAEHYRIFKKFVRKDNYFRSPYAFLTNHYLPFLFTDRLKMVNMYYAFEPVIFRYFFGNKWAHSSVEVMLRDSMTGNRMSHGTANDFLCGLRSQIEQIHESVVKRQLENLKQVCTTITGMYHCKGDRLIPQEVPLRVAVEKCFGFNPSLSLHYASAVFSYEYYLTSRLLDRFKTCEDCHTLCNLISAFWCDESGMFLKVEASVHWKALGRQLEDTRLLSDIHVELFGEPMRPRWQQQLDGGVQRVIGATTADKGSPPGGDATAFPGERGNTPQSTTSYHCPQSPGFGLHLQGTLPSMCANSRFTRRFCFEFASIMKACSKIALFLSSGQLNDAVDCFYTRVLHPLEQMGYRDAPDHPTSPKYAFPSGTAHQASIGSSAKGMRSSPSCPAIITEGETASKGGMRETTMQQATSQPVFSQAHGDSVMHSTGKEKAEAGDNGGFLLTTEPDEASSPRTAVSDPRIDHSLNSFPSSCTGWCPVTQNHQCYLAELCTLLGVLPQRLRNMSNSVESNEHECVSNFTLALKSLTQLFMSLDS